MHLHQFVEGEGFEKEKLDWEYTCIISASELTVISRGDLLGHSFESLNDLSNVMGNMCLCKHFFY